VTSTNSDTPALPLSDERLAAIRTVAANWMLAPYEQRVALSELLAEVDRLRADAARLDWWLRYGYRAQALDDAGQWLLTWCDENGNEHYSEGSWSEAIDAAIDAASRPPTGDEGRAQEGREQQQF
jgi:hypothetical protein